MSFAIEQYVAIKNQRSNRYVVNETNKPTASGIHPFLQVADTPLEVSNKVFLIQNSLNVEYSGPLILGSQQFMVCRPSGEITFEKMTSYEASQSKTTKFVILDANNLQSKRQSTLYDDIVFKFNETNFMICELSMQVNWNGTNVAIDSCWKIQKATCPPQPDWVYLRPNISQCHLSPQTEAFLPSPPTSILVSNFLTKKDERKTIGSYTPQIQQLHLIEDLLFCMMGIEGTYIRKRVNQQEKDAFEYVIEPNLDQSTCEVSLSQMLAKVLPICAAHDQVEFYISQKSKFDYGRVSQALCAGLRVLMKEYITMVNQLDNEFNGGELTLQKLWYYIQPSFKVLMALQTLVTETEILTGGALLSRIYDLINNNTDRQICAVYSFLIEKAFEPYFHQVSSWIYYGEVKDSLGEFFILEKNLQKTQLNQDYRDNYWESRFTLKQSQVPKFFEKYKDIILRTGKYLNVVRESLLGEDNKMQNPHQNELLDNKESLVYSQDFSQILLNAFEYANKQIIELIFKKEDLLGRLKTIKKFFMNECGDFFIHFLEVAEEELGKSPKMISKEKLESLLDMAVRSVSQNDSYKEDIIGYLDSYTIIEQLYALQNLKGNEGIHIDQGTVHSSGQGLRGIDLFTIDLKVNKSFNNYILQDFMARQSSTFKNKYGEILNYVQELILLQVCREIIKQYMVIALKCKRIRIATTVLEVSCITITHDTFHKKLQQNFVQMEAKFTQILNFEDALEQHNRFIENCLTESLLMNIPFMRGMLRITKCCLTFAQGMKRFTMTLTRSDPNFAYLDAEQFPSELHRRKYQIEQTKKQVHQIIEEQSYYDTIESFSKTFEENSKELLKMLYQLISNQNNYLIGLVTRLDFEGHYAGLSSFGFQQGNMF